MVRIEVPLLRARREEIPLLAAHFLQVYAARYNRPAGRLSPETLARFLTYYWPGNVRELENLVKRICSQPLAGACASVKMMLLSVAK